jgi:multiple sugar transport system permease protein
MRSRSATRWAVLRSRGLDVRLLLVPYVLGTLLLVVAPAMMSVGLAFTAYDALGSPTYRGLGNFADVLGEPLFWTALGNSVFFVVLAVPLRVAAALALALLMERPRRGIVLYRTAVYLPTVIPDIAYAFVWLWILNPLYGPLNLVLAAMGLPAPAWLADSDSAKPGFVLMSLFQIGEGFVILLAGLSGVPHEQREAAAVDGASGWQTFRHVVLPLLVPWLLLLGVRDIALSFQSTFAPSYLMTGGDPYYSTLFLPLLIYEEAFDRFRFGIGSAVMILMSLAAVTMVGLLYLALRSHVTAAEEA